MPEAVKTYFSMQMTFQVVKDNMSQLLLWKIRRQELNCIYVDYISKGNKVMVYHMS